MMEGQKLNMMSYSWFVFDLNSLLPARECLVSDIPAGDGKIANQWKSFQ